MQEKKSVHWGCGSKSHGTNHSPTLSGRETQAWQDPLKMMLLGFTSLSNYTTVILYIK